MKGEGVAIQRILQGLTDPQREAVCHRDGPLLVLAGPGSGKTRVITRRAAYLAAGGVDPTNILAITFTNKAANEMAQRIAALGFGRGMTVCTFHSLCARLLRQYADRAGLSPSFTIFDQADRLGAVRQAMERCGLSGFGLPPGRVEARISRLKNAMHDPDEAEQTAGTAEDRELARIYRTYEAILAEQNALDFDDLLLRMARLLGRDAELRDQLEDRFRYVLVDEYQDTNHAQYLIARGLALRRRNLCATGDPDQSIYGWRGANLGNILDFENDFPEARVVRLEQNYRSTKNILAAADGVIRQNRARKHKELWTHNAAGPPVQAVECPDAPTEARYIATRIRQLVDEGLAYGDVAVFYRVNALTRLIEEGLRQAQIPYRIVRGVEFYSRAEIKDVLAYLRVLVNPLDETALLRIINTPPRGIGKTTVDRLRTFARATGIPLIQAIREARTMPDTGRGTGEKLDRFARLIETLQPVIHASARSAIENVLRLSGLGETLLRDDPGDSDARQNVDELISAAAEYDREHPDGSLVEWLQQVSLVSDQDTYDPEAGAVTLMTLHASKGLEFPAVFIAGFEENILPHEQRREDRSDLEEERRLAFVGMTRAKRFLTLTFCRLRDARGTTRVNGPSRFLGEIPRDTLECIALGGNGRSPTGGHMPACSAHAGWQAGQLVRHPSFGLGRLLWVDAQPSRTRAGVRFNVYGDKILILERTRLERVDVRNPYT